MLARIPALPPRRRIKPGRLKLDPAVWEAFRSVQVQLELDGDRCPVVMFTSPSRSDGKTSSAINFALQLADSAFEVVLVDLDFRKPDLAARLGMAPSRPASPGSVEEVDASLRRVPGHPTISLLEGRALPGLGSGFRNAPERFAELLAKISVDADYVVVDVPPLGEVTDSLLFASAVTDIVLVARVGHSRSASVEVVRDLLLRAELEAKGYLLIGADTHAERYYYPTSQRPADRDGAGA